MKIVITMLEDGIVVMILRGASQRQLAYKLISHGTLCPTCTHVALGPQGYVTRDETPCTRHIRMLIFFIENGKLALVARA